MARRLEFPKAERGPLIGFLLVASLTGAIASAGPAAADSDPPPTYDGAMAFGEIMGPAGPEEYSWQVQLGDGQELRAIDGRHAEVYYEGGHEAFGIEAEPAHDAIGTDVPTTLGVTSPDVVTLTVHHRAGNPLAGGAAFNYPIIGGTGWEGGFQTFPVKGPKDEAELREEREQREAREREAARLATDAARPPAKPKVLVINNLGSTEPVYRPHRFLLSGDGTFGMTGVRWKQYGGKVARADATAYANNCIPFCAAGHFFKPPAKLRLTKVVQCNSRYLYAHLHYELIGHLPHGLPRQGGFSLLPRDEVGGVDC